MSFSVKFATSHLSPFNQGSPWQLSDENGTHLEGTLAAPQDPIDLVRPHILEDDVKWVILQLPWPEWKHPPVTINNVNGEFIFDCTLSWWSRYIGISPYFSKPISLLLKIALLPQ